MRRSISRLAVAAFKEQRIQNQDFIRYRCDSFHTTTSTGVNNEQQDAVVSSIAEPLAHALDTMHTVSGIPWWITLMTGGAAVRMALFPLTRKAQQATAHVMSAMTQTSEASSIQERVALMREKAHHIMGLSKNKPSPLWMVASPVIQASVLVYSLYSVRYMAHHEWAGFDTGGPWWAPDLTLPAIDWMTVSTPLGIKGIVMPALLMVGLHVSLRRIQPPDVDPSAPPLSEGEQIRRWALSKIGLAMEVLTIPVLFGVLAAPQAPLYYWTTSIYTSLAMQRLLQPSTREQLSPEAKTLLEKAASRVADGTPDQALPLLEQALVIHPNHPSPLLALAQVSASRQDWALAKMYYQKVVDVTEHRPALRQRALFGLGIVLSKAGEVDAALSAFQRAASYSSLERDAGGQREESDAVDENQKGVDAIAVRSLVAMATLHHTNRGETERAIDLLTRASQMDPRIRDTFLKPLLDSTTENQDENMSTTRS